jgi:hypothetical protein
MHRIVLRPIEQPAPSSGFATRLPGTYAMRREGNKCAIHQEASFFAHFSMN